MYEALQHSQLVDVGRDVHDVHVFVWYVKCQRGRRTVKWFKKDPFFPCNHSSPEGLDPYWSHDSTSHESILTSSLQQVHTNLHLKIAGIHRTPSTRCIFFLHKIYKYSQCEDPGIPGGGVLKRCINSAESASEGTCAWSPASSPHGLLKRIIKEY